jgi:hypothetical protein
MTAAGMFLGVNTAIYENIKNKQSDWISLVIGGGVGATIGAWVPVAIPIYAASIPCYFVMDYLDKNKLI